VCVTLPGRISLPLAFALLTFCAAHAGRAQSGAPADTAPVEAAPDAVAADEGPVTPVLEPAPETPEAADPGDANDIPAPVEPALPTVEGSEGVSTGTDGGAIAPPALVDDKAAAGAKGKRPLRFKPWEDDLDASHGIAEGSIELCDALTFPLRFVPYVGEVAGIVFEWACLVPGAFSVDFVGLYHGTQDGQVWQALVALFAAKLWRDLTRWPVVIGIGAVGFGVVIAATAVAFGTPLAGGPVIISPTYLPVLITGVLVASGVTYVVARKIRKKGQGLIFEWIYSGITPEFESTERRQEAQDEAWLRTPLNGVERLWALGAVASGDDADSSIIHLIPIVGRLEKADARATSLKSNMRRLGDDVLDEKKDDYSTVDTTIDVLAKTEGALGAIADVGLIIGAALFFGGSVFAAIDYQNRSDVTTFAALTLGTGVLGTMVGSAALLFIALREVPKALRTVAVPLAWGVMPPNGWFDVEEPEAEPGEAE
jgi:hypothetical protein